MSAQPQPRLTPEQYLEIERASELRHEYYNGRMFVMSGGTHNHAIIIHNIDSDFDRAFEDRDCLSTTSDLRVCVAPDGLYTYPDIVVVCGTPKYLDGRTDTLLNPLLLIEVLSPSTEGYDRGFKAMQFRKLPSLREYALVAQAAPIVEIFRRQPSGDWLLSEAAGMDSQVRFESVDCTLPLARIYRKVTFAPVDAATTPSPGA